jgi:hypothetical protein
MTSELTKLLARYETLAAEGREIDADIVACLDRLREWQLQVEAVTNELRPLAEKWRDDLDAADWWKSGSGENRDA